VEASGVYAELWPSTVPSLEGTLELIAEGVALSGSKRNLEHACQGEQVRNCPDCGGSAGP
jgi:hypothetical protein